MTEVAAQPGPGEERLDQLRAGGDLTDAEAAAWLVQVMADYHRQPVGWKVDVAVGRHEGPERTRSVSVDGRLPQIVAGVMDQAQTLANTTRRPVKVVHGVDSKPEHFLRTLAEYDVGMDTFTSPVWVALPEPLPHDDDHTTTPAFRGPAPAAEGGR
ncbi:hypothetical protein [Streptomyces roseoverticillatus]|uniref:Uncharacterized protein n=1 Tax=Streptomyces roseoverticillatus TaxID=66429 RepID=A0ABV3ITJ1_9ACTN